MDYRKTFAKRLIKLREQKNITQQELADKLGITRQSLSLYEKTERTINIELLAKIADFFNVSTDYLMGRTDTATLDENIQTACKVTGLNEKAILKLESDKKDWESQTEGNGVAQIETCFYVRNKIISSRLFGTIIECCCELYENSTFCLNNWGIPMDSVVEFSKKTDISVHELLIHIQNLISTMDEKNNENLDKLDERCDLNRYDIFKSAEKISDMFDRRDDYMNFSKEEILKYLRFDSETLHKMQQEDNNNAEHNPTSE